MGPAIIGALGAIGAGAVGAISNGIQNQQNLNYQRQNLDYQKALQAKIFEREDTAIQRRKRDLEAAGFNPYLAMNGNGAGAGAVVSTQPLHSSFDSNPLQNAISQAPGAFVDMARSLEQLKQDKLQTQFMKLQNVYSNLSNQDYKYWLLHNYGFVNSPDHFAYFDIGGDKTSFNMPKEYFEKYKNTSLGWMNRAAQYRENKWIYESIPLQYQLLQNELEASGYNNEILKVKRDFAVSDKIEQYILDSIGALTGASNSARGWYDSYNKHNIPPRAQNYRESYQRRKYY